MNRDKKLANLLAKIAVNKDFNNQFITTFVKHYLGNQSIKKWPRFENYFLREVSRLSSKNPVLIESAIELNSVDLNKVLTFIKDKIGDNYNVSFKIRPELVAGVRIFCQNKIYDISLQSELNLIKSNIK